MQTRSERQQESVLKWRKGSHLGPGIGTLEGCTGYGKTRVATMICSLMTKAKDELISIKIVVPTTALYDQWKGILSGLNFRRFKIYTIQGITVSGLAKEEMQADIWIYDEIHLYIDGPVFSTVFRETLSKYKLGLTGTLTFKQKPILERICPIVDTVPFDLAVANGWVAELIEYNLYVTLTKEERDYYNIVENIIVEYFPIFKYDYDSIRKCKRKKNGYWDGVTHVGAEYYLQRFDPIIRDSEGVLIPNQVDDYLGNPIDNPERLDRFNEMAIELDGAFKERQEFLYNCDTVKKTAIEVIDFANMKTVVFGESILSADDIAVGLENSKAYHSKLPTISIPITKSKQFKTEAAAIRNSEKLQGEVIEHDDYFEVVWQGEKKISCDAQRKIVLDDFKSGKLQRLVSAKAVDVGLDAQLVQLGVNTATTSNSSKHEQRKGRVARKEGDKVAHFVNIIPKQTQAEKWFKRAQQKSTKIRHIYNIEDLIF
jgi:hypothetical protein